GPARRAPSPREGVEEGVFFAVAPPPGSIPCVLVPPHRRVIEADGRGRGRPLLRLVAASPGPPSPPAQPQVVGASGVRLVRLLGRDAYHGRLVPWVDGGPGRLAVLARGPAPHVFPAADEHPLLVVLRVLGVRHDQVLDGNH